MDCNIQWIHNPGTATTTVLHSTTIKPSEVYIHTLGTVPVPALVVPPRVSKKDQALALRDGLMRGVVRLGPKPLSGSLDFAEIPQSFTSFGGFTQYRKANITPLKQNQDKTSPIWFHLLWLHGILFWIQTGGAGVVIHVHDEFQFNKRLNLRALRDNPFQLHSGSFPRGGRL